jgi:hypothetical protein
MMPRTRFPFLIALPLASPEAAARNPETGDDDRLVEARKFWERAPHNAFTDLTHLPIAASRTPARVSDRNAACHRLIRRTRVTYIGETLGNNQAGHKDIADCSN